MANEKSRNHDTGGGKSGASKHQGKPKDQDQGGSKPAGGQQGSRKGSNSASGNPNDDAVSQHQSRR